MKQQENTGKFIETLKRDNPFGVPEGYFQSFPDRLNNTIEALDKKPLTVKKNINWLTYAAAAALLLFVLAGSRYLLHYTNQNKALTNLQREISQEVEHSLYSINEDIILEVMGYESIAGDTPDDNKIIDFLINDDIGEYELMHAL
ncbi:MAG: hypothetical protein JXQ80_06485 [Bacteroidales bacterium]|nr:hypothetical protein [Bacteroidales bacterium]